jgi:hypothetical protein
MLNIGNYEEAYQTVSCKLGDNAVKLNNNSLSLILLTLNRIREYNNKINNK